VGLVVEGKSGAMVELNTATDFVARSPIFQSAATALASIALEVRGDHDRLLNAPSHSRALNLISVSPLLGSRMTPREIDIRSPRS
jgi:translation elongation factor EF-Ts